MPVFSFSFPEIYSQISYRFKNYGVEDGLPHNVVGTINQDEKGFIWIGTNGGLCSFDGYNFKSYYLGDKSPGEEAFIIKCLYHDSMGRLWIGTEGAGLVLYNSSLDTFRYFNANDTTDNCISSNLINSISADSSGILWVGTDKGLNRFNFETNEFEWIQKNEEDSQSISSDLIQKVFVDSNSKIWIGTSAGLDLIDPETRQIINYNLQDISILSADEAANVEAISEDKKGNILIGTYNKGLFIFDKRTHLFSNIIPDRSFTRSHAIRTLLISNEGMIWLGTRGGAYILDEDYHLVEHLTHSDLEANSINHISIRDIYEDNTGGIWIATRNGISYFNSGVQSFTYYGANQTNPNSLNDPEIYSILESKDGNIWIGTESGGINILDKKTGIFSHLKHKENDKNTISPGCIKSIIQDKNENFWIGVFLGGLEFYDSKNKKFIHYKNDPDNSNSISDNTVWALYEDKKGNIWIGTDNGLDRFDVNEKRFYHYKDRMKNHAIHTIFEDKSGNLYFGSSKRGLSILSPDNKMKYFDLSARVIHEDKSGRIWIGSDEYFGLQEFDVEKGLINSYTIKDGLSSNQIFGILEDNNSQLWLSTGQGLSVFDPEKSTFKNYKMAEPGVMGSKFNYGAYCKSRSGEMYFGGPNGLGSFYPEQMTENQNIPPVWITNLKILNQPVPIGKEFNGKKILEKNISETEKISINYAHSVITLDFVALNYFNSPKNEYAYKLDGFEKEWNYVGSTRSATYTNLDPGSYVFMVKASNNDGIWNETGKSLEIIVKPPFSKTLLFKALIFILTILIIYFIISFFIKREKLQNQLVMERMRSRELHNIDTMKFQFFTNISHEIRTPISLILGPLSRIKNTEMSGERIKQDIDVVYRNAVRLGKLIDQLLDFRKIEAGKLKLELSRGDIVSFLKNVLFMFEELSDEKKVKLEFHSVLEEFQLFFDADKVEKILFNLLSNSFKHTPPGGTIRVALSLTYEMDQDLPEAGKIDSGDYIQIVVKDTGSGIPKNKRDKIFDRFYQGNQPENSINTGSGIGLTLTKELVKVHNGKIFLSSKEGKGTKLTVLLPVVKEDPHLKKEEKSDKSEDKPETSPQIAEEVSYENLIDCEAPVILVIEDNKDLLDFIRSVFDDDYKVIIAEDGEVGLNLANETIPNLIISDIMMPKMDGKKLCKIIKDDFRTSHIPIILLTALSSKEHEKEGILAGADEYITKPFDPSILKIKADQLLATRRMLREKFNRDIILQPSEINVNSPDDKFLQKLVGIIEENISDAEFGTVKISREVGVSRTQLYRKMAALTDMTVKEFVRSIRLKRASQLLFKNNLNVSEVAYAVGFQQVAYFRKCFKEMYGLTPSEYAKKNVIVSKGKLKE
ncbi:MAG: response regulator [Bacteroidales bacterium]|nr:response regulator [Bacteroidales bacterium]MCF8390075.1 response regulator [Bacteroidales bacterium]